MAQRGHRYGVRMLGLRRCSTTTDGCEHWGGEDTLIAQTHPLLVYSTQIADVNMVLEQKTVHPMRSARGGAMKGTHVMVISGYPRDRQQLAT